LTGQSKNRLKARSALSSPVDFAGEFAPGFAFRCTRQYLPGGLLINAMEILRLCGVASSLQRTDLE
jgi:hypothetical protein